MNIEYKESKDFTIPELQRLFLSVKWESGNYPEKLVRDRAQKAVLRNPAIWILALSSAFMYICLLYTSRCV